MDIRELSLLCVLVAIVFVVSSEDTEVEGVTSGISVDVVDDDVVEVINTEVEPELSTTIALNRLLACGYVNIFKKLTDIFSSNSCKAE